MSKPWKVIVVLIGIFALGGVTGGFASLRYCRNQATNRPVPEEWAPKHLKRLNDKLELTAEQQEQIRPIVRYRMEQLNRVRNASLFDIQTVVEAMQKDIAEHLTVEQKPKFDAMNLELRKSREDRERAEREKRLNADKAFGGNPGEKPPGI